MKLGGKDITPPHTRSEFRTAVVRGRRNDFWVVRHGVVRVHEIGRRTLGNTFKVGSAALDVKLVPAHVGNFAALKRGRIKPDDSTFENVEPLHSTKLDTLREENLHTYANAKQRCSLAN